MPTSKIRRGGTVVGLSDDSITISEVSKHSSGFDKGASGRSQAVMLPACRKRLGRLKLSNQVEDGPKEPRSLLASVRTDGSL